MLHYVVLSAFTERSPYYEERNDLLKIFVMGIVVHILLVEICSHDRLLFNLLWGKINNTLSRSVMSSLSGVAWNS